MSDPVSPDVIAVPQSATVGRRLPTTVLQTIVLRFGVVGLNAVTGIVTARALHPEGRGEFAAMVIWPILLAGMTTFGLPSALVYHMRRDPKDTSVLVGWALALCVITSLIGTVAGWFLVPLWLRHHPPHIVAAAQLCLLGTCLSALPLVGRAAWEAKGRFAASNLAQLIAPAVIIMALAVQVSFSVLTPVAAAATYVLAGVPVAAWILFSVARECRPTLRGGNGVWRRLLHYGGRSYGMDLCGILSLYLDQALVVGLLSSESMGLYAVALSVSRVVSAVHGAVASMVFPKVVGLATDDMVAAVSRSARMGTIAASGVGLFVLGVGPLLLTWLYGPAYSAASHILPILVCEVMVGGLYYVLLQGFLAAGRPGVATMIQVVGIALSVPLFLVLVPAYGVVGAAFALLASSTMRLLFTVMAYRSVLGGSVPRVWIGAADIAELGHYRSALVSSLARFRTVGEVK